MVLSSQQRVCGKELARLRPRPNDLAAGREPGFRHKEKAGMPGLHAPQNENPARADLKLKGRGLGNPQSECGSA